SRAVDPIRYRAFERPLQLVGILQGDVRLGLASAEYLAGLRPSEMQNGRLLVLAKAGRERALVAFLSHEVNGNRTQVFTLSQQEADRARALRISMALFAPIAMLLSLVLMVVVGVIQRMDTLRRLPELGMLHVMGLQKRWLLRRLLLETVGLALGGWLIGLLLPMLILSLLIHYLFAPHGYLLTPLQAPAFWLTIPIPLAVLGFTAVSLQRLFARLDGIALIERGELPAAPHVRSGQRHAHHAAESHPGQRDVIQASNPHGFVTFYQRHRGRTTLLIGAMMLTIMAVALITFLFTTSMDASFVRLGHLRLLSMVAPAHTPHFASGVTAQLQSYPAVERVIPTKILHPLALDIPPFSRIMLEIYAVTGQDLPYLVEHYGLTVKAGRLPKPRTNEVIIAEAVAQNRHLTVGDRIGEYVADADAPPLPVPLVVTGIFARATQRQSENLLSFASLEFVQSHAAFNPPEALLVIAKAGAKAQLDEWLVRAFSSEQIYVTTYAQALTSFYDEIGTMLTTLSLLEGVIALIAAVALGVLNHFFVGQRQAEFGVLYALGYGRRWLIRRTLREMLFITALAWGLSVLLCGVGLIYLQVGLFQPRGLALDFFDPTPWYYTLPVPVAVLLASAITVVHFFRRLDPVVVIERA
ncbi:MAG: ABC transporter permease, partial [Caldilineaceae bacterium]|nr:ABC transporter permease [Caldilineaceae bacterium]